NAPQSDFRTDHRITLVGLTSNTTYHFRLHSVDVAGNESHSADAAFATLALPDLTPTELAAPLLLTSTRPYPQVQTSWVIANPGAGPAQGGWYDAIYFSTDGVLDSQDTRVGSANWNSTVSAQASYTNTQTITLPVDTSGTYYLIIRANDSAICNCLNETDTSNNDLAVPITFQLTPLDLATTDLTAPAGVESSQPYPRVQVNWVVANHGTGQASAYNWYDRLYLSTDPTWDSQDIPLDYFYGKTDL